MNGRSSFLSADQLVGDYEQAVLGGVMVEAEAPTPESPPQLASDDFFAEHHRVLWGIVLGCLERGERPSITAVLQDLLRTDQLEAVGGRSALAHIYEAGALAIPVLVEQYAVRIREAAVQRSLAALRTQWEAQGWTRDEIERRLALIPRPGLTRGRKVGELWNTIEDGWGRAAHRLGLGPLDAKLGGLRPGELIVVGARPSHGKTSLLVSIALAALRDGVPTLLLSLETSAPAVLRRCVAAAGHLRIGQLRSGALGPTGYDLARQTVAWLETRPLEIRDVADLGTSQTERVLAAVAHSDCPLVLVDHLQEVVTESDDTRALALGRFVHALHEIAVRDQKIIVIAAQLLRAADRERYPVLGDLKESGGTEEKADIVLLLHYAAKRDEQRQETEIDVIIAKNRDGATGKVTLRFLPEYGVVEGDGA